MSQLVRPFDLPPVTSLTVTLDGDIPVRCDGRNGAQGSRALVYWAEGLSPGQHNITLKHTGNPGQFLNIDYFVVSTA